MKFLQKKHFNRYCHAISHWEEGDKITTPRIWIDSIKPSNKWPLRKNVGHRGDKQMLVLGDLTQVAGHQEEEERSQIIGRDPKTEVGTPSPQQK